MNIKKAILCTAATATAMLMASDTPEVANVTMTQASFGRQVTITYELNNAPNGAVVTLDVETNAAGNVWASIGGAAVCNAQGAVWRKVTSADADGSGKYTITWRPDLSWEGHKIELANGGARAVVTAWALNNTPNYMVVDISAAAQPNTQRYYPAVDFLPGGILGKDEYRKTAIVMRKIMAKDITWTMGSTSLESQRVTTSEMTHKVTLTNNYYIGVFPITQAQWGLIQTARPTPSYFSYVDDRAMRPVEKVSYNEIRMAANSPTAAAGANEWPGAPYAGSFLDLLRTKTGLGFDLPSEAQWEFAARAGNGDTRWGDGSAIKNTDTDANLDLLGRYKMNGGYIGGKTEPTTSATAANGTAIVGSYAPNNWGLYDMHGNVWQMCLDWYTDDITAFNGAVYTTVATQRVRRGGAWNCEAGYCRPASRSSVNPDKQNSSIIGFRVAINLD